jgi:hypothetical protein
VDAVIRQLLGPILDPIMNVVGYRPKRRRRRIVRRAMNGEKIDYWDAHGDYDG